MIVYYRSKQRLNSLHAKLNNESARFLNRVKDSGDLDVVAIGKDFVAVAFHHDDDFEGFNRVLRQERFKNAGR